MTLASRLRALRWPAWLAVGAFYGTGALGLVVVGAWEPAGPAPVAVGRLMVVKDQARVPAAQPAPWAEEEPWQPAGSYGPGGYGWHRHHHGSRVRLGPPIAYTHSNRRGRR